MDAVEFTARPAAAGSPAPPGPCPIQRLRRPQPRPARAPKTSTTPALRPAACAPPARDPATPLRRPSSVRRARSSRARAMPLSTRRIASAVDAATSIYLHFKSKDSLIYALIDEGFEELNRRVVEVSKGTGARALLRRADLRGLRARAPGVLRDHVHAARRADGAVPRGSPSGARRPRRLRRADRAPRPGGGRRGAIVWSTLHGLVSLLIAQRIDISLDREAPSRTRSTPRASAPSAALPPEPTPPEPPTATGVEAAPGRRPHRKPPPPPSS